jgi:phosphatidylserine decarboxylase
MSSARQESRRFLFPLHALNTALFLAWWLFPATWPVTVPLFLVFCGLAIFIGFFFRDPERAVPADPAIIVSGADGLVTHVDEIDEPEFGLGRMKRVSVFLSVFDVHVNRAPVEGRVVASIYKPGQFLDARHADASRLNEFRAWHFTTSRGPVTLRQVAGLIARRIVPFVADGATVQRGERLGLIRFGSRTDVLMPLECTVLVKVGDRVQGAASPLARWPSTGTAAMP